MATNKRFTASQISRDLLNILRSFPSIYVEVRRASRTYTALKTAKLNLDTAEIVYKGEALRAVGKGGDLFRYPLGQVTVESLDALIINGKRDLQQGDFVTLDGRLFTFKTVTDAWGTWTVAELQQYQQ